MKIRFAHLCQIFALLTCATGTWAQSANSKPVTTNEIDPALLAKAQEGKQQPSLEFGSARVSLGMTVDQVEKSLAAAGMHLGFIYDGKTASGMTEETASVISNNATDLSGDEGQVTFYNGRVGYAAFQFAETGDAVVLAQELAGAIENIDARNCSLENFTAHGTGGGHADSIFTCGSKTIRVMTIEPLGGDRLTNIEIEIGTTVPGSP